MDSVTNEYLHATVIQPDNPDILRLGQVGSLEVVLAGSKAQVMLAQNLRYKVFYEEMSALPSDEMRQLQRDIDPYDDLCDHLLVIDRSIDTMVSGQSNIVGTYRMLQQQTASDHKGFYSQSEYNVAPMTKKNADNYRFLELGRSCVLPQYRRKKTLELLWYGLWNYLNQTHHNVLIGCASFEGRDPAQHAEALSFLHHHCSAGAQWSVRAHDDLYVNINLMPPEQIDQRRVLRNLPALLKGYLRLGAMIGDGAVVDQQFGTTDVFVIMPVENMNPKYVSYFSGLH